MPTYRDLKKLVEDILMGAKTRSDTKSIQAKNFPKDTTFISGLNLYGEYKIEGDPTCSLGKSVMSHIIRAHNKPALKAVLNQDPGLANHFFPQEHHPLYQAALLNSKEMVAILIKFGADPTQLVSKTTDSTDPRQQGLNKLFKTNFHETVELAIRANDKINQDIKKIIKDAATDARTRQTANLTVVTSTVTDDSDDSRNITFRRSSDESSSSNSTSNSSRLLNRNSRDQSSDQSGDDEENSGSSYHRN